jgi:hypothetical protein
VGGNRSNPRETIVDRRGAQMNPPKIAERLLLCFLAERDRDCISGDLAEAFETKIQSGYGSTKAKLWYWKQVLLSIYSLFVKGRARSNVYLMLFGAAIGIIVSLISWEGNWKPHVHSNFPNGLSAVALLGFMLLAVWFNARQAQAEKIAEIKRIGIKISAIAGVVFGTANAVFCITRFPDFPFIVLALGFAITFALTLLYGWLSSALVAFIHQFRIGYRSKG